MNITINFICKKKKIMCKKNGVQKINKFSSFQGRNYIVSAVIIQKGMHIVIQKYDIFIKL